jgi:hypothetical protein
MSHRDQYCECSMPNSQKRCRVACGLPRVPDVHGEYFAPDAFEKWEKLGKPVLPDPANPSAPLINPLNGLPYIDLSHISHFEISAEDELEPVLDADGKPMMLHGYPVMQKKERK